MNIDLDMLIPEPSTIQLVSNGGLKQYELRAMNLRDEAWLTRTFGSDLSKIFAELQMEAISKIIFHLLVDKSDFAAEQRKEYDDDGLSKDVLVTGAERVMEGMVSKKHQLDVLQSLLKTMGVSRPVVEAIEKEEASKKKTVPRKKQDKPQTGAKSLT